MVTVGDKNRLVRQQPLNLRDHIRFRNRPELVLDAVEHAALVRLTIYRFIDQRRHLVLGVGIETEDRTHVAAGRRRQLEPVLFRTAEGLLVREDLPRAEWLKPQPREELLSRERLAAKFIRLVIRVDRRLRVAGQRLKVQPARQVARSPLIHLVRPGRFRRNVRQIDRNDVVVVLFEELLLVFLVEDVVRRCDEVADVGLCETDRSEGLDVCHGASPDEKNGVLYHENDSYWAHHPDSPSDCPARPDIRRGS